MNASVLIVDDDTLLRWSVGEKLTAAGCRVRSAGSAAEALEAAGREAPDVVLLDLKLPDADGWALLPRLRSLRPTCRILVMSAFGAPGTAEDVCALGAEQFLPKPFDLDELVRRVGRPAG